MRETKRAMMVALAASCLLGFLPAPGKQIVIVVHEFPNYIFHLFVPAYVNPETRDTIDEYFELLNRALRIDDPGPIVSKYRGHLEKVKTFVPFEFGPYLHSLVPGVSRANDGASADAKRGWTR